MMAELCSYREVPAALLVREHGDKVFTPHVQVRSGIHLTHTARTSYMGRACRDVCSWPNQGGRTWWRQTSAALLAS